MRAGELVNFLERVGESFNLLELTGEEADFLHVEGDVLLFLVLFGEVLGFLISGGESLVLLVGEVDFRVTLGEYLGDVVFSFLTSEDMSFLARGGLEEAFFFGLRLAGLGGGVGLLVGDCCCVVLTETLVITSGGVCSFTTGGLVLGSGVFSSGSQLLV